MKNENKKKKVSCAAIMYSLRRYYTLYHSPAVFYVGHTRTHITRSVSLCLFGQYKYGMKVFPFHFDWIFSSKLLFFSFFHHFFFFFSVRFVSHDFVWSTARIIKPNICYLWMAFVITLDRNCVCVCARMGNKKLCASFSELR